MTAQQNRSGGGAPADANASRQAEDPGAYIGRKPERVAETIPGGLGPRDERAAAVATQSGPSTDDGARPDGHREGRPRPTTPSGRRARTADLGRGTGDGDGGRPGRASRPDRPF